MGWSRLNGCSERKQLRGYTCYGAGIYIFASVEREVGSGGIAIARLKLGANGDH